MNDQTNAPLSPEPAGISGWVSTWITAITKPNEQTFATMAEHPDARTNSRAFTWVFLAGTVSALISGVLQAVLGLAGFSPQVPGMSDLFGTAERGIAFNLGTTLCVSPIAGAFAVLGFAIFVGIVQWVAKMFKGTGTFSQLAYPMAAISVPASLISSVLAPFASIQYVSICTGLISVLFAIYTLVLELMAVKAVNKFGWGQAAGSVFLPALAFICCAVGAVAVMTALGVAVADTFNSINSTLP